MSVSVQPSSTVPDTSSVSNTTIIPPEVPQEPLKKNSLHIPKLAIILIVVYAIALYGFVGYLIVTKKKPEQSTTTTAIPTIPQLPQLETENISSGSATSFTARELAKLRVIDLSTYWEDWYTTDASAQAQYIHAVISKEIVDRISAYRVDQFTYIAPKNWLGDVDISAQFGTTSRLFPTKDFDENGPIIRTFVSAQSPKEGLRIGSQFFPWIRANAKELGIENELLPNAQVSTVSAITPHLVTYSNIVYDIYEVLGVIFCNVEAHYADKQWETIQYEVRLPRTDRAFANQLITTFIDQFNLKNK